MSGLKSAMVQGRMNDFGLIPLGMSGLKSGTIVFAGLAYWSHPAWDEWIEIGSALFSGGSKYLVSSRLG